MALKKRMRAAGLAAAAGLAQGAAGQTCTPGFDGGFTAGDVASTVNAAVVFDDGSGPALYIGGVFTTAGAVSATRVAKWDGAKYVPLGQGLNSTVQSLAVFDADGPGPGAPALHAGGSFTMSGSTAITRVARWDGTAWNPLGVGTNSTVNALAVFDEDGAGAAPARLFAAGDFTTAGGGPASRVARWDGSVWSVVGTGCDNAVNAMGVHDAGAGAALYLGGSFTTAGGVAASRLARWNGTAYSGVGSGTANGDVQTIGSFDPDGPGATPAVLIVGGDFTAVGGVSAARIARWNGTAWADLAAGCNSTVRSVMQFNDGSGPALFAAGLFSTAGGLPAGRVARWDGSAWAATSGGIDSTVTTLLPHDDGRGPRLYAFGQFAAVEGGQRAVRAAMWNGSVWSAIDRSVNGDVNALAAHQDASGSALVLGGDFTRADGRVAPGVARYDGAAFSALGTGTTDGSVRALASFNDGTGPAVYAAGAFTTIAGLSANRIARWNGSAWATLGTGTTNGVNSTVNALAVWNDGTGPALYAAGFFGTAGGVAITRIARWNGSSWAALGSGLNSTVNALAVYNDGTGEGLYAAGSFTTAGGSAANRIARWNGTAWAAAGTGLNATVNALAVYNDGTGARLYAGGTFTQAGTASVNQIARWDGTVWADVGAGTDGPVNTMAVYDDDGAGGAGPALFVGGTFTNVAGGLSANRAARWNGSAWSALGPATTNGMDAAVMSMGTFGGRLYVGGLFTTAGGASSLKLARWGCAAAGCYANCDNSTGTPMLNVNDFVCFQSRFAAGDSYANCDGSTTLPALNVNDFVCFQSRFAAGCR